MFTGIITDVGEVLAVERRGDLHARIQTNYDTGTIDIGASIACSGACLTVVEKGDDWFAVDISGETEARTTLGRWKPGVKVNLERALRVGDELGGHIVTGHVDGVGEVIKTAPVGESVQFEIGLPEPLRKLVATKGSVTIDGISMTVNGVTDGRFDVNAIPHTQQHTTLGGMKAGDAVNLEIDMLARYVQRLMDSE
ncbi:MAG TPA: riboflavin synthase [Alphaproteobacteria bacterium]|nr:riboflavin synthase [Alphaproteobacteria bacterium]